LNEKDLIIQEEGISCLWFKKKKSLWRSRCHAQSQKKNRTVWHLRRRAILRRRH